MPAGDRTGPRGMGPMTGRGMGYCAGYAAPGFTNSELGLGWGRGWRGGGRGWRHWYHATGRPAWARAWGFGPYAAPLTGEQESELLKSQAEALKRELDAISKRLNEIESRA
ncbi:MAG: DUF5320 domain-containing protein [Chloroflexota bacterium]